MDEAAGIATAITPLSGDPDQDLQRLENLARDGIEPRISGLRMRALPISSGGYVVVLRIPKSWTPPHRVSARNSNRIYGRNSAGAYEFSIDELRVIFTSSAAVLDRVRAFRAERLARIASGDAIVPLVQNRGRLVVHLVPISAFGLSSPVEPGKARELQELLSPIDSMGYSPRVNFDGFSNICTATDSKCVSYTQVFRNGAIEAVKVRVVSDYQPEQLLISTLDFDRWIFEKLPKYLSALQRLEVPTPIVLMITLQGVRGARLGVAFDILDDLPKIDRDVLELPECLIEQFGPDVDYQRAARPAFDALWNTGGFVRSKHFDSTGKWAPPSR
ncbi:hypothetical protein MTX20_28015 [Bradyrhizobium sp. ISRA435]|nr:hypothetical protein MTX20_28015 [Bradyrhizobium sp. ISRA435]